jgi:hypothetical protein
MLIMHVMTVHVRPNLKVLQEFSASTRVFCQNQSTSFRILIALKSYLPDCLLVWTIYNFDMFYNSILILKGENFRKLFYKIFFRLYP